MRGIEAPETFDIPTSYYYSGASVCTAIRSFIWSYLSNYCAEAQIADSSRGSGALREDERRRYRAPFPEHGAAGYLGTLGWHGQRHGQWRAPGWTRAP